MLNRTPVALWSLIFMVLGVGVMALSLLAKDDKVMIAFLTTGGGIVTGAFAVFQHSQGAASTQNPSQPGEPGDQPKQ